jgi:copper chaperone CopZ
MDPKAKATKNLAIDGMTGDECVRKVSGALKSVPDVSTKSVSVGAATIWADEAGCTAACGAVKQAGYKATESAGAAPAVKP